MQETKFIYDAQCDPVMQNAYFDADETRRRVLADGRVLPYRYVHGGIREKAIKFIFCFPPKESYQGRFFQYLSPFPGPDEELASLDKTGEDDKIAFCLLHGAYYVESNMGSASMFGGKSDATLCYKASAAAAEWSRKVAMEYYGCSRPYGYVHGGSGGGYKTMACIENTNAWDGAAPYVIGSPYSLPNTVTMHVKGQRVLRHVFPRIFDAIDAGGSGDMYEGLTTDEADTLRELTAMGIPPRAWYFESRGLFLDGSTPVLLPGIKAKDPSYFDNDFWTVPGYEGADPNSTAYRDRLVFTGTITFVDFDFEEHQEYPAVNLFATPGTYISADENGAVYGAEHTYTAPGTYFASVRVKAERHGDKTNPFTQVKNLARARVIVEE